MCNLQDWTVANRVFQVSEFFLAGSDLPDSTSILAVVPAICKSCGHVHFLHAQSVGAFEDVEGAADEK